MRRPTVKMISEGDATGKVKGIYDEIKSQHRIDFVPNLYKVMAPAPITRIAIDGPAMVLL